MKYTSKENPLLFKYVTVTPSYAQRSALFLFMNQVSQKACSRTTAQSAHSLHYTGNTSSNRRPSSLEVLAKPGLKARPGQVHNFLVMLTKASFFLALNCLRGGIHECMCNVGIYVHLTWNACLPQLLLQGLRALHRCHRLITTCGFG